MPRLTRQEIALRQRILRLLVFPPVLNEFARGYNEGILAAYEALSGREMTREEIYDEADRLGLEPFAD